MRHHRSVRGFGYGVVATIAMSVPMVLAVVSGFSPLPRPVPKAVVVRVFGGGLPTPAIAAVAVGLHLAYGGLFGALLATVARPVTVAKGLGLGVFLWLVMQTAVLPALGWGAFGTAVTPRIAVATLALHLVYGGTLGWAMDREAGTTTDAPTSTVG